MRDVDTNEWRQHKNNIEKFAALLTQIWRFYVILANWWDIDKYYNNLYIWGEWRDTDLAISDVQPDLRVRQRLCPEKFRGTFSNSHSNGRLQLNLEGKSFSEFFKLSPVREQAIGVWDSFKFNQKFEDILLVQVFQ